MVSIFHQCNYYHTYVLYRHKHELLIFNNVDNNRDNELVGEFHLHILDSIIRDRQITDNDLYPSSRTYNLDIIRII